MVTASATLVYYQGSSIATFEYVIVLKKIVSVQTPGHVDNTVLLRKGPAPQGFLTGISIGMTKTAAMPTQEVVSIRMEVMVVTPEWTTAVAMMGLALLISISRLQLPLSSIPSAPLAASRYVYIHACMVRVRWEDLCCVYSYNVKL